mmetsp:Transcript_166306/g.528353  ORF Transcript_166306/g.528353 Transcript_166306/m.528353 type:complete len:408 (+) Transcript_166306:203-1426(+)
MAPPPERHAQEVIAPIDGQNVRVALQQAVHLALGAAGPPAQLAQELGAEEVAAMASRSAPLPPHDVERRPQTLHRQPRHLDALAGRLPRRRNHCRRRRRRGSSGSGIGPCDGAGRTRSLGLRASRLHLPLPKQNAHGADPGLLVEHPAALVEQPQKENSSYTQSVLGDPENLAVLELPVPRPIDLGHRADADGDVVRARIAPESVNLAQHRPQVDVPDACGVDAGQLPAGCGGDGGPPLGGPIGVDGSSIGGWEREQRDVEGARLRPFSFHGAPQPLVCLRVTRNHPHLGLGSCCEAPLGCRSLCARLPTFDGRATPAKVVVASAATESQPFRPPVVALAAAPRCCVPGAPQQVACRALRAALEANPRWAAVGPREATVRHELGTAEAAVLLHDEGILAQPLHPHLF